MELKQNLIISIVKIASSIALIATITPARAFDLKNTFMHGHPVLQAGGFWSDPGQSQHININTLIGNDYTVTSGQNSNGLVGLGYFIDGQKSERFNMTYGVNAFYLGKTNVSGNVVQESLFTNLSYGYHVTHVPVYAVAKATIDTNFPRYALTLDAGIGPNFMTTGGYHERSLGAGTIPDNAFSGKTTTTFSATAGVGLKLNNVLGKVPIECGYRFFYLGQGNFNRESNQILTTLNTGNTYANALVCSVSI